MSLHNIQFASHIRLLNLDLESSRDEHLHKDMKDCWICLELGTTGARDIYGLSQIFRQNREEHNVSPHRFMKFARGMSSVGFLSANGHRGYIYLQEVGPRDDERPPRIHMI